MRMFGYPAYILYLYVLLTGCASQQAATTGASGKYSEDLSAVRPKISTPATTDTSISKPSTGERTPTQYVEPKLAVNKKLDTVLDSIDRINLSRKFIEGFTIQVYSGRREEALNIKKQLASLLPDLESEVQFTEPIFRVKAGKYFNRMDLQKDYTEIKRYFPSAIVIPDRIAIN